MDDAVAFRALDPERVLARLSASRWALVRTVMAARIGIAAASLLLAARPGDGPGVSWWNVGVFAAYLVWTIATGLAARRVSDLLTRAPRWFWLEQAICVGLVVLGGGVRSIRLYLCAMPVILATVLIGPRLGVMLAGGDSVAVAAALGGAALLGRTPGTQAADGTVWPPALIGFLSRWASSPTCGGCSPNSSKPAPPTEPGRTRSPPQSRRRLAPRRASPRLRISPAALTAPSPTSKAGSRRSACVRPPASRGTTSVTSLQRDAGVLRGAVLITNEPGQPVSVTLTFPVPTGA